MKPVLRSLLTYVQIIRENGGLQRLIAFIMDTSPPEEDDKKGKKPVEKGASRTGKKGKGDDGEFDNGYFGLHPIYYG